MQKITPDFSEDQTKPQEKTAELEYEAVLTSEVLSGKAKLSIGENGFVLNTVFDSIFVSYADLQAISLENYTVRVDGRAGSFWLSQMGMKAEWCCGELLAAFHKKTKKALLIDSPCILETRARYRLCDETGEAEGDAKIEVFEDCICLLPADAGAQRIPFAFLTDLQQEDYRLILSLRTGERLSLSQLGYDMEALCGEIKKCVRALREKTIRFAQKLDPSLGGVDAQKAAKLLPEGRTVEAAILLQILPSFGRAIEQRIEQSRIGPTYPALKRLGAERLFWGMKAIDCEKSPELEDGAKASILEESIEKTEESVQTATWLVAPNREESAAAVELILPREEAAATIVYRTEAGFEKFLLTLDRALDAARFQREVITMSLQDLTKVENEEKRMLIERTPSLKTLRGLAIGRVIHSSPGSWEKGVEERMRSAFAALPKGAAAFCANCGAKLEPNTKFCGQCGKRHEQ